MSALQDIIVKGARLHNLKDVNVRIPKYTLTVITGLSGSGKSTLAFDTIYAEGQRRYVESLSTYARQFLSLMQKPEVDSIDGLSPAISIDQKTAPRNPRSTVGTVTEIYDYLRLLYAKVGTPHCPECGETISRQSATQIVDIITDMPEGRRIMLLAPVVKGRKGSHIRVLDKIKQDGFVRVRIDGEILSVLDLPPLDEKKAHTIEIVVDRLVVKDLKSVTKKLASGEDVGLSNPDRSRLADSVETTLRYGEGVMSVVDFETNEERVFSEHFACEKCGISIPEIEPRSFSFNSPHGACLTCHGLGTKLEVDPELVIPNTDLSLEEGAIAPWSFSLTNLGWYNAILDEVAKVYGFSVSVPVKQLSEESLKLVMYGTDDQEYRVKTKEGNVYKTKYEGVVPNLERRYLETDSDYVQRKIEAYMRLSECPDCKGNRLRREVLAVKIADKSIIDATALSVEEAVGFFDSLGLTETQQKIAHRILQEINSRLQFLRDVGLNYLTLNRAANTLSGGEAQRIRLATQIGSKLSGVLYVLDEPSIGLHQNDNEKLIGTMKMLRDLGNTVIVVEHDVDTMLEADYILDIGPGAGKHGGEIVAAGTPQEIMDNPNSVTGQYLSGSRKIEIPKTRRRGNGEYIKIFDATENNLQHVNVELPLGTFIGVSGVSGSGKSTLINDILVKAVTKEISPFGGKENPGKHGKIEGIENIDKMINIDQSPIGRTPRSNPVTYTGIFTEIRKLFSETPEALVRGYKLGRFSFNTKGGRCEACTGDGLKKIEMHFLPDIYVPCEECKGKRYNRETLEVTYRGKNIADVLSMTVEEAIDFFAAIPQIKVKLQSLLDVGLNYVELGQTANTLSGGEAQRIKLAAELSKRSTGSTLYILDEPTTGLHFDDVKRLLSVLQRLVDAGNTVITIEHNLDVIKTVDYIIDLGPEGGTGGGQIVAHGTPEKVAKTPGSYTGKWLAKMLG